jgi:hypothetical protein
MAVSIGIGIVFATVITLFLIPCLYLILEGFKAFIKRLVGPKGAVNKTTVQRL